MILSSGTKRPKIHSSAYVAPTATVSGEVEIGAGCAVLHGAVLVAEGAPLTLGTDTVVMENAVVKASGGGALHFPCSIGARCIVGPHAYVVGAAVGDGCFVAASARVGNGAQVESGTAVGLGDRPASFLADVFNAEAGPDAYGRAAQTYARALRKAHAQDAVLAEHTNARPAPRRGEEPPPTQTADVGGVVDAMMLELEELEHRRQEALRKQKGR